MTTSTLRSPFASQQPTNAPQSVDTADSGWSGLYRAGAVAALVMVALIPVQIAIFFVWPPPLDGTALDWFTLFQDNWFLGLLSLDLLYILTNALLIPLYLALYVALRRVSESAMALALVAGLVGLAAYFASTVAFEVWSLSNAYAAAANDAERSMYLAAGEAMLATFQGTAFDMYYVLNAVALVIIAVLMLRSTIFTRTTAYMGLLAGAFMVVPSTFGTPGLVFALASLIPWAMFSVLVARRLMQFAQGVSSAQGGQQ